MNPNYINIRSLTLDELVGVVNLYPWFGSARKELCGRMSKLGGSESWGREQFASEALYVASRKKIADIVSSGRKTDFSDSDIEDLLRLYIKKDAQAAPEGERPVRAIGGDYFSQSQYDRVRREEDNVFSRFVAKTRSEASQADETHAISDVFCTETLAQIYAEQGYFSEAKQIYSKLILAIPEKSAYFANLIENLEKEIKI